MELDDFDVTVKVIVVGNGGVGKTSLTTRFCKGVYTDTYKKTIGVDFMEKDITQRAYVVWAYGFLSWWPRYPDRTITILGFVI